MRQMLAVLSAILVAAAVSLGAATQKIYDEQANAQDLIKAAVSEAAQTGKNLAVVFGANW